MRSIPRHCRHYKRFGPWNWETNHSIGCSLELMGRVRKTILWEVSVKMSLYPLSGKRYLYHVLLYKAKVEISPFWG